MNKTLKRNIFGLAACVYMCMTTCLGYGWITHEENRSHVFCSEDGNDVNENGIDYSKGWIRDEGFKWKNSLDFTVNNGTDVYSASDNEKFHANELHQKLSSIVQFATSGHGCASAVTVITKKKIKDGEENDWTERYESETHVVGDKKPIITLPVTDYTKYRSESTLVTRKYCTVHYEMDDGAKACEELLKNTGMSNTKYSCCEGQMLYYILGERDQYGLTYLSRILQEHEPDDVVSVIIHLHSKHDPCGKCSNILKSVYNILNNYCSSESARIQNDLLETGAELKAVQMMRQSTTIRTGDTGALKNEKTLSTYCLKVVLDPSNNSCNYSGWNDEITEGESKVKLNDILRTVREFKLAEKKVARILNSNVVRYENTIQNVQRLILSIDVSKPPKNPYVKILCLTYLLTYYLADNLPEKLGRGPYPGMGVELINVCDCLTKMIQACCLGLYRYTSLIEVSSNKVYSIHHDRRDLLWRLLKERKDEFTELFKKLFVDRVTNLNYQDGVTAITRKIGELQDTNFENDNYKGTMLLLLHQIKEEVSQMSIPADQSEILTDKKDLHILRLCCLIVLHQHALKDLQGLEKEASEKIKDNLMKELYYTYELLKYECESYEDQSRLATSCNRSYINSHARDSGAGSEDTPLNVITRDKIENGVTEQIPYAAFSVIEPYELNDSEGSYWGHTEDK